MSAYSFEALDANGQTRKGVIDADTAKAARGLLRAQALVPLAVESVSGSVAADGTQAATGFGRQVLWARPVFNTTGLAIWTRQIAGLVAAAGFALYSLAYSPGRMLQLLRVGPRTLIGWGLLLAAVSGLPALAAGMPFLTALWAKVHIPGLVNLKVGSPLIFDVGVFLVVVGVVLTVAVALQEEEV